MERNPSFQRSARRFTSPTAWSTTSSPCMDSHMTHVDLTPRTTPDDMFTSYQSSPESTFSYLDSACLSPVDDQYYTTENQILATVRDGIYPYSKQLSSLSVLPFVLNPLEASLVSSYLSDYPESVYGFSPSLRPHPTATILASTLQRQSSLHFIIARVAAHRLSNHQHASAREQADLEIAMITHKGEAIQAVRAMSGKSSRGPQDSLMASIVGLGFLDCITGADDAALVHFRAARRMMKSIGGPLKFRNVLLLRILLHFDCSNRPTSQSYLWDREDFAHLHRNLNGFFGKLQSLWKSVAGRGSMSPPRSHSTAYTASSPSACHDAILREDSVIRECLSRSAQNRSSPTQQERQEIVYQLTSLLILCAAMVDNQSDSQAMQDYSDSVHRMVDRSQLQGLPSNNIMWLLQINDHSPEHTKRVWSAAGWVWVLRHVNFNVQCMVRDWLLMFLTGKTPVRQLKLDSFAFSYAS